MAAATNLNKSDGPSFHLIFFFLLTLASLIASIGLQELLSTRQPVTKSSFKSADSVIVAVGQGMS